MRQLLREHRRWLTEAVHGGLAVLALAASFLLRFEFTLEAGYRRVLLESVPILLVAKLVVFRIFGLRDLAWRYMGFPDLSRLVLANTAAAAAAALALRAAVGSALPRSIPVLDLLVCLSLMAGARAAIRSLLEARSQYEARYPPEATDRGNRQPPMRHAQPARRILIFGAGKAGVTLLAEIQANPQIGYRVAGFLDDDPQKRNLRIHGVRVMGGREELPAVARQQRVDEVLVAVPGASGNQIAAILEKCHSARVAAKRVPALAELMEHRVLVEQVREVRIEDLLGRPPVQLEESGIRERLAGRIVAVTGAGGSIGSELCRQIARYQPAALIGFDQAETALYHVEQELREKFPRVPFFPEVGNIQSRRRLEEVFREHRPASVYHAAAYKHVPLMEGHLFEAVENNVLGTRNVAQAAAKSGVEDFVLVSSDKAVRPANVMGATKRLAELVCLAAGNPGGRTRFMAVRFGNVLGSNGSVIPLFRRQIAAGGPVTVTHPEMRRFFMTIPEAAQLVLQAAAIGAGGEIFALEMGAPVRIMDLARNMVLLSGLRPDEDIRIEFSGIRPGEKLCEELSGIEEDSLPTPHAQIRIFTRPSAGRDSMAKYLEDLRLFSETRDAAGLVLCLKEIVPDYNPSALVLRRAFEQGHREKARIVVA